MITRPMLRPRTLTRALELIVRVITLSVIFSYGPMNPSALFAEESPPAAPSAPPPAEQLPLHERIDQLIEAVPGPFAPIASDDEFLRRISLDLIGMPPTPDEVRQFLADTAPNKRQIVIDRLLASPLFDRHLSNVFDVLFMERRAVQHITDDEWRAYLVQSIRSNKPYNVLAKELLSADGTAPATRPATRFFLGRTTMNVVEPNLMTRDISRVFFGRDMQCAQCHDHPIVDDYKQSDYQGLLAFLQGTTTFVAPAPDGKIYLADAPGTAVSFESVFFKGERHVTGPRVPGSTEILEPAFAPGNEYTTPPATGVRPVPKFNRRTALAEAATDGSNRWFNETAANRFWSLMLGRGLVDPLDLHHSANPPSHPKLMRMLGEEFAKSQFNIKSFLRELALTRAYQRSIDTTLDGSPDELATQQEQLVKRQEELDAVASSSYEANDTAIEAWQKTVADAATAKTAVETARKTATETLTARDAATAALNTAVAAHTAKQDVVATVGEAVAKSQAAVAKLPGDAEFAALAQKMVEKQTALSAEAAALAKDVEAKQAAATQAEGALTTSQAAFDVAQTAYTPLAETIHAADQAMATSRHTMLGDLTLAEGLGGQAERQETFVAFLTAQDAAQAATAAIPPLETQITTAKAAVDEQSHQIAAANTQLAAAKQQMTDAANQRTALDQEAARRQAISDALGAAIAQASTASAQLPDDVALAEAIKTLQAKSVEATARVTEMADAIAQAQATAQQTTSVVTQMEQQHAALMAEMSQRQQAVTTAESTLAEAKNTANSTQDISDAAYLKAVEARAEMFATASLKPLTAEQLCFSVFRVVGVYESYRAATEAEVNTAAPLPADATPEQIAARTAEIEQKTFDKLKGNIATFAGIYAAGAGQPQGDFFATADQALFSANGETILAWLNPAGGNLTERMTNQTDPALVANDLYMTVLSRQPTEAEMAEVVAYLAARPEEKPACVKELAWGLLTSAEFRFNH